MPEAVNRGLADEDVLRSILDRLEQREAADEGTGRRKANRFPYRVQGVKIRLIPPSGGAIDCLVSTVDLSNSGIGFLYRGFLYNGTEVQLTLHRRTGGDEQLVGDVVRCQHAAGAFHLIGVRFRQPIYPRLFVDTGADGNDGPQADSTEYSRLHGHVLFVDTQELDQILFQHHASRTSLRVEVAGGSEAALEAARLRAFDAIIVELNLGADTGEDLIRLLRMRRVNCPIIVLTAENSTSRLHAAQKAGASAVVAKPYEPDHLLNILKHLLDRAGEPQAEEAIYSELPPGSAVDQMISQFIDRVRRLTAELEKHSQSMDFAQVRALCLTLKANGSGYGFPILTETAKTAVTALDASMSVEETSVELTKLLSICRRLASGRPPANPAAAPPPAETPPV